VSFHAETYIPTQPPQTGKKARFPFADEDEKRAGGAVAPSRQGTQARLGEARLPRVVPIQLRIHVNSSPKQKKPAGFPKAVRLLRHADFERVYQQGRRHFSPSMTVFFLERESGEGPRVGLTVGKVLGNAVTRNRIKRRMREALRKNFGPLSAKVDVVINPKKSAIALELPKLEAEIERALAAVQQGKGVAASDTPRRPREKKNR
jgi:ribonuclease P protein component